jgi:uncharacterized protein (UPF0332 family)
MNPLEFITLANTLAVAPDSGPAGYRSAVSRAYYGAFLTARSLIQDDIGIKCKIGTVSAHTVIQMFLQHCHVPQAVQVGIMLSNLHERRKRADYDMDHGEPEDQAISSESVAQANDIIERLQGCRVLAIRQQIHAGILQYKRETRQ